MTLSAFRRHQRLAATAPGLLMLDVQLPLTDKRELGFPRYTQPEAKRRSVLEKPGWELPVQPPPRIRATQVSRPRPRCGKEGENVEALSKHTWKPREGSRPTGMGPKTPCL